MRIKLIEAARPISTLEYNINKNILPAFNKYGLEFNIAPLKINDYVYSYRGNSTDGFATLRLNTANPEIDLWNDANADLYIGDLFAKLTLNGEEIDLGVISSKDPSSVEYIMNEINLADYDLPTEEKVKNERLIPAKMSNEKYNAMTNNEWIKVYRDLDKELEDLQSKIKNIESNTEDKDDLVLNDEYMALKDTFKTKYDYFHKVFLPNIFPDEIKGE